MSYFVAVWLVVMSLIREPETEKGD